MRTQLKLLVAGLLLALAFIFSCSGDGDSPGPTGPGPVNVNKISGVSQKGPFAKDVSVTVYELNARLEKTGNYYVGKTTDSKGNFEVEVNEELASPYVILEVNGKYTSEVTGEQSNSTIKLKTVSDVSGKSNVNINVLTHLEFEKVIALAQNGKGFDDAKKEAQKTVLNALGISESGIKNSEDMTLFGGNSSDSVLLVVSVLMQANRSPEYVSALLDSVSNNIKTTGTLSEAVRTEVANGLANLDMDEVKKNILSLAPNATLPNIDNILEDIKDVVVGIDSSATLPSNDEYCKWPDSDCPNKCCLLENPNGKDPNNPNMTNREACIEWSDGLFKNSSCIGFAAGGFNGEYCKWGENNCSKLTNPDGPSQYAPGLTNRQNCIENSNYGIFNNATCSGTPVIAPTGEWCKTSNWGDCPNNCCHISPSYINPDNGLSDREICTRYEDGVFDNATCTGTPVVPPAVREYCKLDSNHPADPNCPTGCCQLGDPDAREICIQHELGVYSNATCTGTPVAAPTGEWCKRDPSNPADPNCANNCCRIHEPDFKPPEEGGSITVRDLCREGELGVYNNPTCTGTPIYTSLPKYYCKFTISVVDCPNSCCFIPERNLNKQFGDLTQRQICEQIEGGLFTNSSCQ